MEGGPPLRQFENPLHNGKTTECSKKAEWRRDSAHFPLDLMQWDVLKLLVILYVSDTQYSFAYFAVKTKAHNVIISYTVQLWLLSKMLFLFVWILLLCSTTSLQSWGRFYEPPGSYNGRLIKSCIWSTEWRHFQWPWMTLAVHYL